MFKVEIRVPDNNNDVVDNKWFDTLVSAESYVAGFNTSAIDGRVAIVVPFH